MGENHEAKRYSSLENTSDLSGCSFSFFPLFSDLKLEIMPLHQSPACSDYRCGHQARILFLSSD